MKMNTTQLANRYGWHEDEHNATGESDAPGVLEHDSWQIYIGGAAKDIGDAITGDATGVFERTIQQLDESRGTGNVALSFPGRAEPSTLIASHPAVCRSFFASLPCTSRLLLFVPQYREP
jgi:hypothetical protein